MMGHSEPERRTKKKKALENVQNAPQPRLSLLNTVYRENLRWDSKRKRVKLAGPWEFRCVSRICVLSSLNVSRHRRVSVQNLPVIN